MTKLQLALDGDLATALELLSGTHPFIDIVEIGTPLIYREGMHGLQQIKSRYPNLQLLADLKIMDAGAEEAEIAYSAGAAYATALGVANDKTLAGAITTAQKAGQKLVIDMMQVSDLVGRTRDLLNLGADVICVHTAYDLQSDTDSPYQDLAKLRQAFPQAALAIAGGVKLEKLPDILPHRPDIVIVGGAIANANNPRLAAQTIKQALTDYEYSRSH